MLPNRQRSNQREIKQARLNRYNQAVVAMKDFQHTVFSFQQPGSESIDFRFFDTPSLSYKMTENDSKWENSITLMENLVRLQAALTKHKEAKNDFFMAGYKSWGEAIKLAQRVLYNSNYATGQVISFFGYRTPFFEYEEKGITCFSDTIAKTTEVVKDSNNLVKWNNLANSVEKTRKHIEGFSLLRKENRLLAGFVGTLSFLLGLGLFVGGILLDPITLSGSTTMILAGTAIISASSVLILKAIQPDIDKPSELIHEEEHSCAFAKSLTGLKFLRR